MEATIPVYSIIPVYSMRDDERSLWHWEMRKEKPVVELVRQYLAVIKQGAHEPGADAELERIYMEVLRRDPNHRLIELHQMVQDGVSFNIAEQVRDLLAEEITALDPISEEHLDG